MPICTHWYTNILSVRLEKPLPTAPADKMFCWNLQHFMQATKEREKKITANNWWEHKTELRQAGYATGANAGKKKRYFKIQLNRLHWYHILLLNWMVFIYLTMQYDGEEEWGSK